MKKAIPFFALFVLAGLSAFGQTRTEAIRAKILSADRNYVFVAMHRGDWRNFPENSAGAIQSCINLGADIVELDVQITKDGRFVLMHDEKIDRTTTGEGKTTDYTVEELKKFRLKKNGKATEYEILTLEEAIEIARGKILINIDKFVEHPKEILDAVNAVDALGEVLVKSNHSPKDARRLFGDYWKNVESGELLYMPVIQFCWGSHEWAGKLLPMWLAEEPRRGSMYEVCADAPEHCAAFGQVTAAPGSPRLWVNSLWDMLCDGHDDRKALKDPDANWGWILRQGATMVQTDYGAELIIYLIKNGRRTL